MNTGSDTGEDVAQEESDAILKRIREEADKITGATKDEPAPVGTPDTSYSETGADFGATVAPAPALMPERKSEAEQEVESTLNRIREGAKEIEAKEPQQKEKESKPNLSYIEQIIGTGYQNLTPEMKRILSEERDPENLKELSEKMPAYEMSDEQYSLLFERDRSNSWKDLKKVAPEFVKAIPEVIAHSAKEFGKWGGGFLRGMMGIAGGVQAQQLPSGAVVFSRSEDTKTAQADREAGLKALAAPAQAIANTAYGLGATLGKNLALGNYYFDLVGETIGVKDKSESKDNFIARKKLQSSLAKSDIESPSAIEKAVKSDVAKTIAESALSLNLPSASELLASDVTNQFNGDLQKARAYREAEIKKAASEITTDVSDQAAAAYDPEMAGAAGWIVPYGNEFSAVMGGLGTVSSSIKAFAKAKQGRLTADEANALARAEQAKLKVEALQKQADASKVGPIGKASEKVANKIDAAVKYFDETLQRLPESVRPYIGKALGAGTVGGLAAWAATDEGVAPKLAASIALLAAPRVISDASKARALAGGGIRGTFQAMSNLPEMSAQTKLMMAGINPKLADWTVQRGAEFAKRGVHAATLATALGLAKDETPAQLGRGVAEAILMGEAYNLVHGGLSKGAKALTGQGIATRDRTLEQYNRERNQQIKTLNAMSEDSRKTTENLVSFDRVVEQAEGFLNAEQERAATLEAAPEQTEEIKSALKESQARLAMLAARLEGLKRADGETRMAYEHEVLNTITNADVLINGALTPQKNTKIEVLTTEQIKNKLKALNPSLSESQIDTIAEQQGVSFGSSGLTQAADGTAIGKPQGNVIFDLFKGSVVINADAVARRLSSGAMAGESILDALGHEIGHALDKTAEYQNLTEQIRTELFGRKITAPDGRTIHAEEGLYKPSDLLAMMARYFDPKGEKSDEQIINEQRSLGLRDKNGNLKIEDAIEYMQSEIIADMVGLSSNDVALREAGATEIVLDWVKTKTKNKLVNKVLDSLSGESPQVVGTGIGTGVKFLPEQLKRNKLALKTLADLDGWLTQVQNKPKRTLTKSEVMANRALFNHYYKDSGAVRTTMVADIVDGNGNVVERVLLPDSAKTSEWQMSVDENGNTAPVKVSGFGELPVELSGKSIPDNGRMIVRSDVVVDANGKPVEVKNVRDILLQRSQLIRAALENAPDAQSADAMRARSKDGLMFRGRLTPAQRKNIENLPELIVPYSIKLKLFALNDAMAKNDGTRMLAEYAARLSDSGRYVDFSPTIIDFVPIGFQFSKAGNFLVTTVSVSGLNRKFDLMMKQMPSRFSLWNYDKDSFMDEFTNKYLANLAAGRNGEIGLSEDPQTALNKKNIFNDLVNAFDANTEDANPDRTELQPTGLTKEEKKEWKQSDPNTVIRSRRLDSLTDVIESNQTKMPFDYGKLKINFLPEQQNVGERPEVLRVEDERITDATYIRPDGSISLGATHLEANPDASKDPEERNSDRYGFMTSTGRVIGRAEAYDIAAENGQLIAESPTLELRSDNVDLASERNGPDVNFLPSGESELPSAEERASVRRAAPKYSLETKRQNLLGEGESNEVIIRDEFGDDVGRAVYRINSKNPNRAEVISTVVYPHQRNKGFGSLLYAELASAAAADGATTLYSDAVSPMALRRRKSLFKTDVLGEMSVGGRKAFEAESFIGKPPENLDRIVASNGVATSAGIQYLPDIIGKHWSANDFEEPDVRKYGGTSFGLVWGWGFYSSTMENIPESYQLTQSQKINAIQDPKTELYSIVKIQRGGAETILAKGLNKEDAEEITQNLKEKSGYFYKFKVKNEELYMDANKGVYEQTPEIQGALEKIINLLAKNDELIDGMGRPISAKQFKDNAIENTRLIYTVLAANEYTTKDIVRREFSNIANGRASKLFKLSQIEKASRLIVEQEQMSSHEYASRLLNTLGIEGIKYNTPPRGLLNIYQRKKELPVEQPTRGFNYVTFAPETLTLEGKEQSFNIREALGEKGYQAGLNFLPSTENTEERRFEKTQDALAGVPRRARPEQILKALTASGISEQEIKLRGINSAMEGAMDANGYVSRDELLNAMQVERQRELDNAYAVKVYESSDAPAFQASVQDSNGEQVIVRIEDSNNASVIKSVEPDSLETTASVNITRTKDGKFIVLDESNKPLLLKRNDLRFDGQQNAFEFASEEEARRAVATLENARADAPVEPSERAVGVPEFKVAVNAAIRDGNKAVEWSSTQSPDAIDAYVGQWGGKAERTAEGWRVELPEGLLRDAEQFGTVQFLPERSVAVVPERFFGSETDNRLDVTTGRIRRYAGSPNWVQKFNVTEYVAGGKFFDSVTGEDLTNRPVASTGISVSGGKPKMTAIDDAPPATANLGNVRRSNLFKQSAGWQWVSENPPKTETLISLEGSGLFKDRSDKHAYALDLTFENGAVLQSYPAKPNEPRLRPTGNGDVVFGPEVGRIKTSGGKEHPVYGWARVVAPERTGVQFLPEDARRRDEEYRKAVDANDTETAGQLVEEAAKAAGYTIKAYHGTRNKDFTIFKTGDLGHHFGLSLDQVFGPYGRFSDTQRNQVRLVEAYLNIQNPLELTDRGYWSGPLTVREVNEKTGSNLSEEGSTAGDIQAAIKRAGYDGVVYENLHEGEEGGTAMIAFNPNQIKSAEPVTRDADGNVIPLSQRFNPEQAGIQFLPSVTTDVSDSETKQYKIILGTKAGEYGFSLSRLSNLYKNNEAFAFNQQAITLGKEAEKARKELVTAQNKLQKANTSSDSTTIEKLSGEVDSLQKEFDTANQNLQKAISERSTTLLQNIANEKDADKLATLENEYQDLQGFVQTAEMPIFSSTKNVVGKKLVEKAESKFESDFQRITIAPPFTLPSKSGLVDQDAIADGVQRKIFNSGSFRNLLIDFFGEDIGGRLQIVNNGHGTWLGGRERNVELVLPKDVVRTPELDAKLKLFVSAMGFGMAQDAAILYRPRLGNEEKTDNESTQYYVYSKTPMTKAKANKIMQKAEGLKIESPDGSVEYVDWTLLSTGNGFRLMYWGENQEGFEAKLEELRKLIGPDAVIEESPVESELYDTQTEFAQSGEKTVEKSLSAPVGGQSLFARIIDSVFKPYAKIVTAAGYEFQYGDWQKRFGLSDQTVAAIRDELYPKNGNQISVRKLFKNPEQLGVAPEITKDGKEIALDENGNPKYKLTVNEMIQKLQGRTQQAGVIAEDDFSERAKKILSQAIADEVDGQVERATLGQGAAIKAVGWYNEVIRRMRQIYAYPEIEELGEMDKFRFLDPNAAEYDPVKSLVFDIVLGATSQGNNVFENAKMAVRIMLMYMNGSTLREATKKLSGSFGDKTVAIEDNINKAEFLLNSIGPEQLGKLFNEVKTISEWEDLLKNDLRLQWKGKPLEFAGLAKGQKATGFFVFGPKIGSFINNLHGNYDTLTADLWFSRTWNRLLGKSFKYDPLLAERQFRVFSDTLEELWNSGQFTAAREQLKLDIQEAEKNLREAEESGSDKRALKKAANQLSTLKARFEAMPSLETQADYDALTSDLGSMIAAAAKLFKNYKEGGFKVKSNLNYAAKNLSENLTTPIAAPISANQRIFQTEVVREAQRLLRKKGLDLTIADIQASLWFNEKELYAIYGAARGGAKQADYSHGATGALFAMAAGSLYEVNRKNDSGKPQPFRLLSEAEEKKLTGVEAPNRNLKMTVEELREKLGLGKEEEADEEDEE
jgi:hypothetical protein